MKTPISIHEICFNYTQLALTSIMVLCALYAYYHYINNHIRKLVNKPEKTNKITIRVLAAGVTAAFLTMQIPYSRTTLDVNYYSYHVDLYTPINIILFLGMIGLNIVVGGTFLTNIKGNARN
jgi:phosphoglycerol transferase MdoB-like AlkP superfamily enzyme